MSKRENRDEDPPAMSTVEIHTLPGYEMGAVMAGAVTRTDIRRGWIADGATDEVDSTIFGPAPDDPETIPHTKHPMYVRDQRY